MSNRVPGATLQMRLPPGSNRTPSHALKEHFSLAKIRVVISANSSRGLLTLTEVFENDTGKTTVFIAGK